MREVAEYVAHGHIWVDSRRCLPGEMGPYVPRSMTDGADEPQDDLIDLPEGAFAQAALV